MPMRRVMLAASCWLLLISGAAQTMPAPAPTPAASAWVTALRAAVPLLCTETALGSRTRVRGSGVIADSSGTLLTAAHVILEAHSNCTLSVMVPDEEWSRIRRLRVFLVGDCRLQRTLDLAICRIRPAENSRDWGYIQAAQIARRQVISGEAVSITAFTGWGVLPLTRAGHIKARENYERPDGCYCNFAMDISAVEGMSGSPVISTQGEVLGILTLAGTGKFRGVSFGASLEEAAEFLREQGLVPGR